MRLSVAISNNRILSVDQGRVTFRWRDYADGNKNKMMTVSAVEFIRRFMLHVLPKGMRRIRHYGLLASRDKVERIQPCMRLTHTHTLTCVKPRKLFDILQEKLGASFLQCPSCGIGKLARASPLILN